MEATHSVVGKTKKDKSYLPFAVFSVGMLAWPVMWLLEVLYDRDVITDRDSIDSAAFWIIGFGFLCCVSAPFFRRGAKVSDKFVFMCFGMAAFVVSSFLCYYGLLITTGGPPE